MSNESIEDFYEVIGRAVSRWARLEKGLFRLFSTIQGASLHESAAIFFAWRAFEQKLNLVNEIMQIRFSDKAELNFWRKLSAYIFALSKERNFIVHNEVTAYFGFKDKAELDEIETVVSYAQAASHFEVNFRKKTPRELKLADLQAVEAAIVLLDIYLDGFTKHVKGEPDASRDIFQQSWSEPFLETYLLPPEKRPPRTDPPPSSQR